MVTVPRLSFYLAAGDDLHARKSFWVAVLVACLILLIGASIVILGAAPILSIFGTEFQSASRILTLVAITAIIEGLCIVSYSYFQAKGQLWLPFFIFAIPRDIALVAAAYVLCPRYGAMGLAFAALIAGTYTMCATFLLLLVRERSHLFARAQ
jgi:O-antigen/teichoic acid export membrane protein